MKKILGLMLIAFVMFMMFMLTGCFSIMRIPLSHPTYEYDEATGTVVTNTVYETLPGYPMSIYPSLHLRAHMFAFAWQPYPEGYKFRRYMGPIACVASLVGLPGDLLVDTIALPWDWNASKKNKCKACKHIEMLKRANK